MALRYLALGDSYTIGEGVAPEARWTHRLAQSLRADGIALEDPLTIAATGWTTDELAAAIAEADPQGEFDFASLLIGVNDQYRGGDVARYRRGFSALLERSIAFAGGRANRVLVLSIPDWGVTPFAAASGRDLAQIANELDLYNATARETCDARGVAFVDITTVSRERGAEPAMLAEDGLHPAAPMHAQWMVRALPAARRLLQPESPSPP